MTTMEQFNNELAMSLRLVAFKPASVTFPPVAMMAAVDASMQANGWTGVSEVTDAGNGTICRYYYDTAQKNYISASLTPATGACSFEKAEELDVLEKLSFPELKALGNLIDKKSVAFIRIYSEKELAAASTDEERAALNERNQKMIDEAEVALRKR